MYEINSIIENHVEKPDDFIVGFADMEGLLKSYPYRYGIVIGQLLEDNIIDTIIVRLQ
jgi:hypothetical protein